MHNVTLSVAAMRICNPDCSLIGIYALTQIPNSSQLC